MLRYGEFRFPQLYSLKTLLRSRSLNSSCQPIIRLTTTEGGIFFIQSLFLIFSVWKRFFYGNINIIKLMSLFKQNKYSIRVIFKTDVEEA